MCIAHFMLCQPELNVFKLRNTAFHNTKYMKKQIRNNFLKLKQQITKGKMQGNFPPRTSVLYRKERQQSIEQTFDLKPHKHLTTSVTFFKETFWKQF